jgi:hypothetical protein
MGTIYLLLGLAVLVAAGLFVWSYIPSPGRPERLSDGEVWLPHAELQGDEPVKVRPDELGPRDELGRFKKIPNLGEVLKASSYNQPRQ